MDRLELERIQSSLNLKWRHSTDVMFHHFLRSGIRIEEISSSLVANLISMFTGRNSLYHQTEYVLATRAFPGSFTNIDIF